jgi:hypothetical protein
LWTRLEANPIVETQAYLKNKYGANIFNHQTEFLSPIITILLKFVMPSDEVELHFSPTPPVFSSIVYMGTINIHKRQKTHEIGDWKVEDYVKYIQVCIYGWIERADHGIQTEGEVSANLTSSLR